ncbi:hypothetical protein Bpfe_007383 [Biomphalaria pfeifferi]|uniref:Uncharacterized protein n=1 Tax=Biomphalaria pfeifferi TaxID=112525 RepID=A0AAD8BZY6_BIOPF|nr:hypothetical protein Bpfe_007383 [Biomphalaria pfeifferi]
MKKGESGGFIEQEHILLGPKLGTQEKTKEKGRPLMTLTTSCEYYQQFIVGPGRAASENFGERWLPSVAFVSNRAETIL